MDGERYGAAWIPRLMAVGQAYRRSVVVVSRRKGNCVMNSHLSGRHVTWIRFEAFHENFTRPFEQYYYAKGFGLVMWEGIETDHKGQSFLVEVHPPGARPGNVRERIACLENLRS
jgi:hypothetical protein